MLLNSRQAKSFHEVIKLADKTNDLDALKALEADLMELQDFLDERNLKRQNRINHKFDFKPSHTKGSQKLGVAGRPV